MAAFEIPRKPLPLATVASVEDDRPRSRYTLVQEDDASTPEPKLGKKKRKWRFFWIGECMAVLFALANLIALVILLYLRKDNPLPNWPSLLGINTLVSIFSSLIKVGLLFCVTECLGEMKWKWFTKLRALSDFDHFDSASRGPWGAIKLIVRRPGNVISTIAAAITVIAVAVDPFTQQVLRFYSCPQLDTSQTAWILRSNNYTLGTGQTSAGPSLDPKMTGALYQGVLNPFPNGTAAVTMFCPSGNCTFHEVDGIAYSTLAVCPHVQDISSTVTGVGYLGRSMTDTGRWNYSLPSGFNISSPYALATAAFKPEMSYFGYDSVFDFEILATTTNCPDGYQPGEADQPDQPGRCVLTPFAARVSLVPCVLSYGEAKVVNTIFTESVKSVISLDACREGFYSIGNRSSIPGTDCTGAPSPQGSKTVLTCLFKDPDTGNFVRTASGIIDVFQSGIFWDRLYYDPRCIFSLAQGSAGGLRATLEVMMGLTDNPQQMWLNHGMWQRGSGNDWTKVFWQKGGKVNVDSVSQVMDNLATSIGGVLRSQGDASNSEPIEGTVQVNQTCVAVVWAWLALPIVLCVCTIGLLISTIIQCGAQNHRHDMPLERRSPWKTSSLPLLWCGLSDVAKEQHGHPTSVTQMRDVSDKLMVALDHHDSVYLLGEPGLGDDAPVRRRWTLRPASG